MVNRAMFRGLSNLQSLSLYGNLVTCVTPGAFDELSSLTSLNLISNPFNCNCHMAWFADWLRRRGLTNSGPRCVQLPTSTNIYIIYNYLLRCVKPVHLKNKAIHALASHEFRCTSKLTLPHNPRVLLSAAPRHKLPSLEYYLRGAE